MTEYKTSLLTKIIVELFGWIFLIGMFGAIWIKPFRWKLFFTAAFCIFLAIILIIVERRKKKEHEENKK